MKYAAVWDKLPIITGLEKSDRVYSASWGYDQTQITIATWYGRAFGFDVLITGAFGGGEVLLKRIGMDDRFSEGCMDFYPNTYTDEEINDTNTRAAYCGR
jgi:hypothetical protein